VLLWKGSNHRIKFFIVEKKVDLEKKEKNVIYTEKIMVILRTVHSKFLLCQGFSTLALEIHFQLPVL